MRLRISALFALALASPAAAAPAVVAPAPVVAPAGSKSETITLPASNGRSIAVSVWKTSLARPRGVVIFGHGMGAAPATYSELFAALAGRGYSVVAPLAVDSLQHPDRKKYDLPAGFAARVEDLMVTRGYVAGAFSGQKVVLAGHSYGSLLALIGGGAKTPAGALKGPPVSALVALSTPGAIPGIVAPDSFAGVTLPLLVVTGTADTVPGFVPDAKAHRLAFDGSRPGGKVLLTVPGGDHFLMVKGDPKLRAALTERILTFLDEQVGGKAMAAAVPSPLFTEERR